MPATDENILFSCLLSKNTYIKIYRTVILPVVYMSVTLRHIMENTVTEYVGEH